MRKQMRVLAFHSDAEALDVPAVPPRSRLLPGSRVPGLESQPLSLAGGHPAGRQREGHSPASCCAQSPGLSSRSCVVER